MQKQILEIAIQELKEGILYYESKEKGLGFRLKDEVDNKLDWLLNNPNILRIREDGYRRINLDTFPYYIAYSVYDNILWILAIVHTHSKPKKWLKRL